MPTVGLGQIVLDRGATTVAGDGLRVGLADRHVRRAICGRRCCNLHGSLPEQRKRAQCRAQAAWPRCRLEPRYKHDANAPIPRVSRVDGLAARAPQPDLRRLMKGGCWQTSLTLPTGCKCHSPGILLLVRAAFYLVEAESDWSALRCFARFCARWARRVCTRHDRMAHRLDAVSQPTGGSRRRGRAIEYRPRTGLRHRLVGDQ
jgi:hypothetical protein